jgi:hypothetical protein
VNWFLSGSTTALLITDKAAADVRPTYDVDAIAEITSYAAYADFSERLRKCGFAEDAGDGASDLPVAPEENDFGHHAARREDPRIHRNPPCTLAPILPMGLRRP